MTETPTDVLRDAEDAPPMLEALARILADHGAEDRAEHVRRAAAGVQAFTTKHPDAQPPGEWDSQAASEHASEFRYRLRLPKAADLTEITPGIYTNPVGARLHVIRVAHSASDLGPFVPLGQIWLALEAPIDPLPRKTWLVTLEGMRSAGYQRTGELLPEDQI